MMKTAALSILFCLLRGLSALADSTELVGTYRLRLLWDENSNPLNVATRATLKVTAKDATSSSTETLYDFSLSVRQGNTLWVKATVQDDNGSTGMGSIFSTRRASPFPEYEGQLTRILASTNIAALSSNKQLLNLSGSKGKLQFRKVS
jgi:hypothetical protein